MLNYKPGEFKICGRTLGGRAFWLIPQILRLYYITIFAFKTLIKKWSDSQVRCESLHFCVKCAQHSLKYPTNPSLRS